MHLQHVMVLSSERILLLLCAGASLDVSENLRLKVNMIAKSEDLKKPSRWTVPTDDALTTPR